MSSGGLLTTGHADTIRLWDVRAGALVRELAVRDVPSSDPALHWAPGESALLLTHSSGRLTEVTLGQFDIPESGHGHPLVVGGIAVRRVGFAEV